jgi:hypothetical protein
MKDFRPTPMSFRKKLTSDLAQVLLAIATFIMGIFGNSNAYKANHQFPQAQSTTFENKSSGLNDALEKAAFVSSFFDNTTVVGNDPILGAPTSDGENLHESIIEARAIASDMLEEGLLKPIGDALDASEKRRYSGDPKDDEEDSKK